MGVGDVGGRKCLRDAVGSGWVGSRPSPSRVPAGVGNFDLPTPVDSLGTQVRGPASWFRPQVSPTGTPQRPVDVEETWVPFSRP